MDRRLASLGKKKGKIDRNLEQWMHRRQAEDQRYRLAPRNALEQEIFELFSEFKEFNTKNQNRPVDKSVNLYLNARMCRHDIWVKFLEETKLESRHKFGDTKVMDFITGDLQLEIPSELLQTELSTLSKTPDILLNMPGYNYIILGDVAVAKSIINSDRRKYLKYMKVEEIFKKLGVRVKHENFIIDESLHNYKCTLNKYLQLGLIRYSEEQEKRSVEYHKTCQIIMDKVRDTCIDPKEFDAKLEVIDSIEDTMIEFEIPEDLIKNQTLAYPEPANSEEEIISWLKEEVKTEIENGYFDEGIQKTNEAFKELLEMNKEHEHGAPKSTLKIVSNQLSIENLSNYELIQDYIRDLHHANECEAKNHFINLLPSSKQVELMSALFKDKETTTKEKAKKYRDKKVFGNYQYTRTIKEDSLITNDLNTKLVYGKKIKNLKKAPKVIDPENYDECMNNINNGINYYGSVSNKNPFLSDDWDAKTTFEHENTAIERDIFNYVKSTCAAQLCHTMSNLYQRIMHLSTSQSLKDNLYVPPNGSFIAIIPKNHAPINAKNCDLPFIFICRVHKNDEQAIKMIENEYEYHISTEKYDYYMSKLCRLNLNKISSWDQAGYRLVSTASYLLSTCKNLLKEKEKVVGTLMYMLLDGHQKTSEFLDLLKYVAYMPFSDVSRLSKLIKDKFDILIKTSLDVWILKTMQNFMNELSNISKLNAVKPKVQLFNGSIVRESLGLSMTLPSFIATNIRHETIPQFIEEVNMLNIVRPKHLYGSQFMEKSMVQTAEWTNEYTSEVEKFGEWVTNGEGQDKFPFNSKFAFSHSAIIHAQRFFDKKVPINPRKVAKKLSSTAYSGYMHNNCSLRGCVKERATRKNLTDLHTTSMESCLTYYKSKQYNDKDCTSIAIASNFIREGRPMEFSMSEKDQRGGGRPIATPTLGAKAALMMIEKPEQAIGTFVPNNIIVEGKHKLKEQSECYRNLISDGAINNYKYIFQLTEDQTKFSENDNTRKFISYIKSNTKLDTPIRKLQLAALELLLDREHLVHKLPKVFENDPALIKTRNYNRNGVKTNIGWPQGMLNFISTSIHSIADYWITHLFNLAYPDNNVQTAGLVHSDDSWVVVACNSLDDFKLFTLFRAKAKRLFCLKLNDKKLWGSRYLGEIVSNYNVNGNVHLSVAKTLANSFGNLIYQNWVIDVHSQISSLQQCYRNGGNLATIIMLSTILRQQMLDSYQVRGYHLDNINLLPIELGGYPDNSSFELAVTGVTCHYKKILHFVKESPTDPISLIILRALRLSIMNNIDKEKNTDSVGDSYSTKTDLLSKIFKDSDVGEIDGDYESVIIPSRGEVFGCIKHILPKSNKIALTISAIRSLPFITDNLEMIVTKPKELSVALGHLKNQTSTMLYQLAAEHYTQTTRRLAVAQSIQSSGKTIRICNYPPMTMNQMLYFLYHSDQIIPMPYESLEIAFNDQNEVVDLCENIVFRSVTYPISNDKRKIINRSPIIDNKYNTISNFRNVLLFMIDKDRKYDMNKSLLSKYGVNVEPKELLDKDSTLIKQRFEVYFKFYHVEYACNLIMQQYLMTQKSKLWMQPYLNNDSLQGFLEDLYGKTISSSINFNVKIDDTSNRSTSVNNEIINSIYTVSVLNALYPDKFIINHINGVSVQKTLDNIDYSSLNSAEYLKYCYLQLEFNNDMLYLLDYDEKKLYDQYYVKPQKFINGKYVGKFICKVKYGQTILIIDGEPGDFTLTSNNNNINDITYAMMIFVKQNFKYYSYIHPNMWTSNDFWRTKLHFSRLYLTSYTNSITLITKHDTITSVSLNIDKNIEMPDTYNVRDADAFFTDDTKRIIFKKVGDDKIKVASMNQNMTCPRAKDIILVEDYLDGVSNNMLLHTKAILHIVLRRYFSCSKEDIKRLLINKVPPLTNITLHNFYINMINTFGDAIIPINETDILHENETTTIDISGDNVMSFIDGHLATTPEDLTYIETDYIMGDEERAGALFINTNIPRLLCKMHSGQAKLNDLGDIVHLIFHNRDMTRQIKGDLDSFDLDERTELVKESCEYVEPDIDVLIYIIGNDFDLPKTWDGVDYKVLLGRKYELKNLCNIKLSQRIITKLMEILLDEEIQDTPNELLRFVK